MRCPADWLAIRYALMPPKISGVRAKRMKRLIVYGSGRAHQLAAIFRDSPNVRAVFDVGLQWLSNTTAVNQDLLVKTPDLARRSLRRLAVSALVTPDTISEVILLRRNTGVAKQNGVNGQ